MLAMILLGKFVCTNHKLKYWSWITTTVYLHRGIYIILHLSFWQHCLNHTSNMNRMHKYCCLNTCRITILYSTDSSKSIMNWIKFHCYCLMLNMLYYRHHLCKFSNHLSNNLYNLIHHLIPFILNHIFDRCKNLYMMYS